MFKDGPVDGARKQWANEEGQPLIAILQEKTLQTATYAVNKDELSESIYSLLDLLTMFTSPNRWTDKNGGDTTQC